MIQSHTALYATLGISNQHISKFPLCNYSSSLPSSLLDIFEEIVQLRATSFYSSFFPNLFLRNSIPVQGSSLTISLRIAYLFNQIIKYIRSSDDLYTLTALELLIALKPEGLNVWTFIRKNISIGLIQESELFCYCDSLLKLIDDDLSVHNSFNRVSLAFGNQDVSKCSIHLLSLLSNPLKNILITTCFGDYLVIDRDVTYDLVVSIPGLNIEYFTTAFFDSLISYLSNYYTISSDFKVDIQSYSEYISFCSVSDSDRIALGQNSQLLDNLSVKINRLIALPFVQEFSFASSFLPHVNELDAPLQLTNGPILMPNSGYSLDPLFSDIFGDLARICSYKLHPRYASKSNLIHPFELHTKLAPLS